MATYRNDPPYLPSVYGPSTRAVALRRRYGAGTAVLLFFFGLLAAVGFGQLVGILLLLLIVAGTVLFLRERRRREWLWLQLARATSAAGVRLRSGAARAGSARLRARDVRLPTDRARRKLPRLPAAAPVDAEAPTAERTDVADIPEPAAIQDGDALRCQAFGMRLRRRGHPDRAVPLHRSAQLMFAETGNRYGEALAANGLGLALVATGEAEAAQREFHRARTLLHELGDSQREGKVLINLGLARRRLGAGDEAGELLREAQARFAPGTYPYQLAERHLRAWSSAE